MPCPTNHEVNPANTSNVNASSSSQAEEHEHVFLKEYESFNEETSLLTKRCRCGFSVQVEEL